MVIKIFPHPFAKLTIFLRTGRHHLWRLRVTCRVFIGKISPAWLCPNPKYVKWHVSDKTGFEGNIRETDKVCQQCYKSHLCILRVRSEESTDDELCDIIQNLSITARELVTPIQRAFNTTCITVAKTLLKQEAILLPSVHDFFMSLVQEHTATGDLKMGEEHVTARFILIVTLGKHFVISKYFFIIIYQRLKQLDIQRFGLLTEAFFRESDRTLDR